jgi:hypothetical protein
VSFIWDAVTYLALCHDDLPRDSQYKNHRLSNIQDIKT